MNRNPWKNQQRSLIFWRMKSEENKIRQYWFVCSEINLKAARRETLMFILYNGQRCRVDLFGNEPQSLRETLSSSIRCSWCSKQHSCEICQPEKINPHLCQWLIWKCYFEIVSSFISFFFSIQFFSLETTNCSFVMWKRASSTTRRLYEARYFSPPTCRLSTATREKRRHQRKFVT